MAEARMQRLGNARLRLLEQRRLSIEMPVPRLFTLIPNPWSAEDRDTIQHHASTDDRADLVERRTGLMPNFDPTEIWAITAPAYKEMLSMGDAERVVYLDEQETRATPRWLRRGRT